MYMKNIQLKIRKIKRRERIEKMREFYKRNVQKKGKRLIAGVIATVLAVMLAIPMNFPVMEAKAEEKTESSIQMIGGKIKKVTYSGEEKTFLDGIEKLDFKDEIVSKVTIQYEIEPGYILDSVQKNGMVLGTDAYCLNEDGTITYDAGDGNNIEALRLRCIPQELEISNLTAERKNDEQGNPKSSIDLSWNAPEILAGSDYALDEYRLIIRKKTGDNTTIILNEMYPRDTNKSAACSYEDKGDNAVSTTAEYIVSAIADKAYKPDQEDVFYGKGKNAVWDAVYDLLLSVNGKGKVKIGEMEYGSSDMPYTIYNIPCTEEGIHNLKMEITPEEQCGVRSLCVNGNEEKQKIEKNTYEVRIEKSGEAAIHFAPLTTVPSITTSGDKYTEIAPGGSVEITSAKDVESTSYQYESLEKVQNQPMWNKAPQKLEGASKTAAISAEELFGINNYAVLKAYSSQKDYADSRMVEQYYYCKPETPAITGVSFNDGYSLGQWSTECVTLNYADTSVRKYTALQIGYAVSGQSDMKWQDMNQQGNQYAFSFSQSGEYSVALRFKMEDSNQPGEFVYGDTVSLADNIKVDTEVPGLEVSGYTSGNWSSEDVKVGLQNRINQVSGTRYKYAVSEELTEATDSLEWKECEADNCVKVSCEKGKILTRYIYMKAVSNAGKESQVVPYQVMIDKEKPEVPEASFSKVDGENGWYKTLPIITMKPVQQNEGSQTSIYYKLYQEGQNPESIPEVVFDGRNQPVISSEGIYTFAYYAKDAVGNSSKVTEQKLYVDTGAPNAPAIEFKTENDSVLAHIVHFITFGYFCNERVVAVAKSTDSMSQIKEYGIWCTQNGENSQIDIIQGDIASIQLPENFKGTVSAYAVDYAGNKSAVSETNGIVYENTQAEITITTDVDNSKWQNQDVNFHVVTQDIQSGLRKVEYILNGKTVYQNDFTDSSHSDVVYMDQQDISAVEEAVTSGGYTLQVKVTDNAGNQSEKSVVIYVDKTAPVISLSGIENGVSSNATENLTVKIEEQIFDMSHVTVSATRTLDGITSEYGVEGVTPDGIVTEKTYAFSEEGLYAVTVNAMDAAGNTAVSKQISFTVDKTAPQIELAGLQNDSYHSSDISLEVNVEESFFDTDAVTINVTKTLDGQTSSVDFGNWSNQGKTSSLKKNFSEDGTYQVEVQAKDVAGNQATTQQLMFTVDKTAPEVSINGAGDYQITGNTLTLSYDVIESYFDTNDVSIQVQKEDLSGNVTEVGVGSWINSGKESSLACEFKEDGIYTSVITAVDKAGNESTVRKTVTVDTSDPIIRHVDEMNGKYYQMFKLPYELSDIIADLTVPDISMYLNSDEYDGISEVTDEGKYVFKMDVSDEVGHKALAQAEFMVDNTAPKFIFNGIEDGMKSENDIAWSVSLADAKDSMKEVIVDGEKQEFNKETNTYQETFQKKGTHTIEVSAEDLAGNTVKKAISVKISEESVMETMSSNKVLIAGGIVVMVVAAGVIAGNRILKKKMKKQ